MIRRAIYLLAAVLLVACSPGGSAELTVDNVGGGAYIHSVFPAQAPKGAAALVLKCKKGPVYGQLAIADVVLYKCARAAITPPQGWTLTRDDGGDFVRQLLYWHAIRGDAPHENQWAFNLSSTECQAQGAVVLLDGAALDSPIDASNGSGRGFQSGSAMKAKSVTSSRDGELILTFFANDFGGAGFSAPDDVGEVIDEENNPGGYWIMGTYKRHRGATGDIVCHGDQGFHSVAATVAIRSLPASE
ncbi:MAG: hypothetical protein ACREQI_12015 [Candidatus Binataceae bacterium]